MDRAMVSELAALAGVDPAPTLTEVQSSLTSILTMSGGWPYSSERPSLSKQRAFGRRILAEAFAQTLGPANNSVPGFTLAQPRHGMRALRLTSRIEVNRASATELAAVDGLSLRRAESIVEERQRGGPFRNLDDLTERIDGIGSSRAHELAPRLGFAPPTAARGATSGDLAEDMRTLVALESSGDTTARFSRALERVAMHVAANRHPHTRRQLPRSTEVPLPPTSVVAQRIRVLPGRRYYYLLKSAIDRAERRIDVAMFHIALPHRDHPTLRLLEALAAARARGVRVRVLVDRDRPDDPYHSVVINAAAIRYLLDEDVPVRIDAPSRLMHSKFLVIDSEQTIIGSHNWSAGSYFAFDDLSLDVISADFARRTRKRFESMWRGAERASARRPPSQ